MSIKLVPNPKPNRAQFIFERICQKRFDIRPGALSISFEDNQRYANVHVQELWELFKSGDL